MLARKYIKKIYIYNTSSTSDGYGGNTSGLVLIGSFWAEVEQLSSNKDNSLGVSDIKTTYSFKIRANAEITPNRNDLSIFFRQHIYIVNDIRYTDENFRFINIVAHG